MVFLFNSKEHVRQTVRNTAQKRALELKQVNADFVVTAVLKELKNVVSKDIEAMAI